MSNRVEHSILETDDSSVWTEWDDFVRGSSMGTVYHTSAWLIPLAQGMGQHIRVHVLHESGSIRAGVVVRRAVKFGFKVARKPWATAYSGIVMDEGASDSDVSSLLATLVREYDDVRLVHPPGSNRGVVEKLPWQVRVDKTPLVDIGDVEALWNRFDRRVRQRVRKAAELQVSVRETAEADTFYDLYRLTYDRQGLPMPLSREEVTGALMLARQAGAVRFFLAATRQGDPAAALVVGADSRRAYFMLAGSHPAHRKTDAMTQLWWHVMQEYANTHREIDLVGHGVPSIDRFKLSFSPTLVDVFDAIHRGNGPRGTLLRIIEHGKRVISSWRAKGSPEREIG